MKYLFVRSLTALFPKSIQDDLSRLTVLSKRMSHLVSAFVSVKQISAPDGDKIIAEYKTFVWWSEGNEYMWWFWWGERLVGCLFCQFKLEKLYSIIQLHPAYSCALVTAQLHWSRFVFHKQRVVRQQHAVGHPYCFVKGVRLGETVCGEQVKFALPTPFLRVCERVAWGIKKTPTPRRTRNEARKNNESACEVQSEVIAESEAKIRRLEESIQHLATEADYQTKKAAEKKDWSFLDASIALRASADTKKKELLEVQQQPQWTQQEEVTCIALLIWNIIKG